MNYSIKIRGELRPVNTPHTLVVRDDATRYSSGTSIPPEEAHAREIARQATRWQAFATQRTRQRPATIQQKAFDAACFSVLKRASSLAIPTKLSGVGAHQRQLWTMTRNRVPVWTLLEVEVTGNRADERIAVLYDDEVIGHMQTKHHGWLRPLIPFGARLYLSKITGSERSGYTLGVNVVVGHVGEALDRLLDALGEAGFDGSSGDGLGPAQGAGGDGAVSGLRLVKPPAPPTDRR